MLWRGWPGWGGGWGRRARWTLAALLAAGLLADQLAPLPLPATDRTTVVLAADGTPLRTYPGTDGVWRQVVGPDDVSPLYLEALVAYEDRWFHWHPGVNPVAMARAAWQWWRAGRVVSGGSTLTMQVARIIDPPPSGHTRSLGAKLRQILRALQLELHLGKREILTIYLNHAPMGGIVEGVEMASRAYLGKSSRTLSHAEAAMLAALPQAPSRLRPDRHPTAAQAARDKVLNRMMQFGLWRAADVADARIETVAAQPIRGQWIAPLAAERARREARTAARRAGRSPGMGGMAHAVQTTLDIEMQTSVERMLLDRIGQLPPKVSMAVLVMDNSTLEVKAYAGSADFTDPDRAAHVDMVTGVRSPGSTLKPFLYALALDEGLVHSESLMVDAPQSFAGYQPGNFQAAFTGPVSVAEALQRSLNVPAVDLLDRLGPTRFASMMRAGGVRLRVGAGVEPNLSLILGGAGTTLEELVGAYRALARGGRAGRPRLTPDAPVVEARLMSEGAAFIVRDILEAGGHPDRPFVEDAQTSRRVAWKTGTSFGFRDAWAIGVTDEHTLGVWVGRPDGTPNPGFFGANVAAPLLRDIVAALPPSSAGLADAAAHRRQPASVSQVLICWPLGLAASSTAPEHCLARRTGWALHGSTPPTLPDRHRTGGLLVRAPTCDTPAEPRLQALWPSPLEPWGLQTSVPGCQPSGPGQDVTPAAGAALRIAGLESNAVLRAVPGQTHVEVTLHALGAAPPAASYWLVNGTQRARTVAGAPVTLQFNEPGRHGITLLDDHGRHHRIDVTVRFPGTPR